MAGKGGCVPPPFPDPGSTHSLQPWTQPVHESTPREKCGPDIFIPVEPAADRHPGEETGHMGPTQAVGTAALKAIAVLVSLCLFMAQTRNPTYHGPSYLREQLGVQRAPQPALLNLAPLPPCLGAHVSASLAVLAGTRHGSPVLGEQKCQPVGGGCAQFPAFTPNSFPRWWHQSPALCRCVRTCPEPSIPAAIRPSACVRDRTSFWF